MLQKTDSFYRGLYWVNEIIVLSKRETYFSAGPRRNLLIIIEVLGKGENNPLCKWTKHIRH